MIVVFRNFYWKEITKLSMNSKTKLFVYNLKNCHNLPLWQQNGCFDSLNNNLWCLEYWGVLRIFEHKLISCKKISRLITYIFEGSFIFIHLVVLTILKNQIPLNPMNLTESMALIRLMKRLSILYTAQYLLWLIKSCLASTEKITFC